ncbi:MAG: hypothetical protein SVC26_06555 [Pseudomonadota bacterium]|nr:hypothetical protein [Pseudomonadota bacterium]
MSNMVSKTGFNVEVKSLEEAQQMAHIITSTSICPKDYIGKSGDALVAMMLGSEMGLNPIQALQNIAVINGRPSLWGDAMLALVQNHPAFVSIEETFNPDTMTASCTVVRKGGKPHTCTFSQEDAVLAGLWGRNTWKQYPKRMLQMRARGFALRDQFADALNGLISAEEARDSEPEPKNMGEAQIVEPEAPQLPLYEQSKFDENFSKWEHLIQSGKKDHNGIIASIETKYALSDEQMKKINNIKLTESAK